jgi:broad specificity phosphatase PhoE
MREIVCIRHLATAWNRAGRLQGARDVGILRPDPATLASIHENRQRLKAMGEMELALVSSLKRTMQTARCYGWKDAREEALLNEFDFGVYEGRFKEDFLKIHGTEWFKDPRHMELGESMQSFDRRIREFLVQYAHVRRVLLFGHGAWIRGLTSIIVTGDLRAMNSFEIPNNEIHVVGLAE